MVTLSFEINKKLREDGIDSLSKSDRNVIFELCNTCMMNPCYKNMILFRYVDQNFIKNLFGIEFLNNFRIFNFRCCMQNSKCLDSKEFRSKTRRRLYIS